MKIKKIIYLLCLLAYLSVPIFLVINTTNKLRFNINDILPVDIEIFITDYISNLEKGNKTYLKENTNSTRFEEDYLPVILELSNIFIDRNINDINIYDAKKNIIQSESISSYYEIWLEITHDDGFGKMYIIIDTSKNNLIMRHFKYDYLEKSITDYYKFLNVELSLKRIIFILLMIIIWILGLWSLNYIKNTISKRKWYDLVFCVLSLFKITIFWTEGSLKYDILSIVFNPITIFHSGRIGEYQLSISIPIIFILLLFEKSGLRKIKELNSSNFN